MGVTWSPLREQLRVCGWRGRRSLRNTWQVQRKGRGQKDGSGEKPGEAGGLEYLRGVDAGGSVSFYGDLEG